MATVNFSVPDSLKHAFNATFKDQNKSAIIAGLMQEAVERTQRRQCHAEAIDRILERRQQSPCLSSEDLRAVREDERS